MKEYKIITTHTEDIFRGKYLKEREKPNWHYYITEHGEILHYRKEHMVSVSEKEIEDE